MSVGSTVAVVLYPKVVVAINPTIKQFFTGEISVNVGDEFVISNRNYLYLFNSDGPDFRLALFLANEARDNFSFMKKYSRVATNFITKKKTKVGKSELSGLTINIKKNFIQVVGDENERI